MQIYFAIHVWYIDSAMLTHLFDVILVCTSRPDGNSDVGDCDENLRDVERRVAEEVSVVEDVIKVDGVGLDGKPAAE